MEVPKSVSIFIRLFYLYIMDIETLRNYCIEKPGVTEEFPFDENTLVFKVGGKMFALCDVEDFDGINLKCDPGKAEELREKYDGIQPGYHMNKKHWNTVVADMVPDKLVLALVDHSYDLVVESLPKKDREGLEKSGKKHIQSAKVPAKKTKTAAVKKKK